MEQWIRYFSNLKEDVSVSHYPSYKLFQRWKYWIFIDRQVLWIFSVFEKCIHSFSSYHSHSVHYDSCSQWISIWPFDPGHCDYIPGNFTLHRCSLWRGTNYFLKAIAIFCQTISCFHYCRSLVALIAWSALVTAPLYLWHFGRKEHQESELSLDFVSSVAWKYSHTFSFKMPLPPVES